MSIDYVIVGILLGLCLVCSYTDLKDGVIRNKYLVTLGTAAILLNAVSLWLHQSRGSRELMWQQYLSMLAIGAAAALILYAVKIWAGGDCKLYLAVTLALPYDITVRTFLGIGFGLYIPILAFLFGYLYIIFDSVIRGIRNKKQDPGGSEQNTERISVFKRSASGFVVYLKYYVAMAFVNSMIVFAVEWLGISWADQWMLLLLNILILFLIAKLKLLEYKSVLLVLLAADVILGIVSLDTVWNRQTLLTWLAVLLSGLMKNMSDNYNYEEIETGSLKKGMILSAASSLLLVNNRYSGFRKISDESLNSRLTEEDIKAILDFSKKKSAPQKVCIVRKVPFALFISLAAIVVLAGGILL